MNEEEIMQRIQEMEREVKPLLSKDALQRYFNIRMAHPENAFKILALLYEAKVQNKITRELQDHEFKEIVKSQLNNRQTTMIRR